MVMCNLQNKLKILPAAFSLSYVVPFRRFSSLFFPVPHQLGEHEPPDDGYHETDKADYPDSKRGALCDVLVLFPPWLVRHVEHALGLLDEISGHCDNVHITNQRLLSLYC